MNSFKIYIIAAAVCMAAAVTGHAQNQTTIVWGGENAFINTFLLADSGGNLFDSENQAMVAMGYFNDGFDVSANATNRQAMYDNFTALDTSMVGESIAGYVEGSVNIDTDTNPEVIGKLVYYWVLVGVTTYDESSVLALTQQAIISDSSWVEPYPIDDPGSIPAGSTPPKLHSIVSNYLDDVAFGTNVEGGGIGEGSNLIRSSAVPEPGFYAAGLGIVALLVVELRRRRKAA